MALISEKDRKILRELAARQRDFAASAKNDEILKKWDALANSRRESPTVRLLYSNFTDEVVGSRMRCEGDAARSSGSCCRQWSGASCSTTTRRFRRRLT